MADYKLMPVEATPEMLAAGEYALEAGCYVSGIYADMCAAAPVVRDDSALQACITYIVHGDADFTGMDEGLVGHFKEKVGEMSPSGDVQGEPVTWSGWGCQYPGKMPRLYGERHIAELNCDWENGDQLLHFTAAPRPAEQQPSAGDSLTSVPDEVFTAEFAAWWDEHGQFCRAGGDTYERSSAFEAWRHLYPKLMNLQMAAAEHQPAPDVSKLVEALEQVIKSAPSGGPLWHGSEQIVEARAALDAYRKRGE